MVTYVIVMGQTHRVRVTTYPGVHVGDLLKTLTHLQREAMNTRSGRDAGVMLSRYLSEVGSDWPCHPKVRSRNGAHQRGSGVKRCLGLVGLPPDVRLRPFV